MAFSSIRQDGQLPPQTAHAEDSEETPGVHPLRVPAMGDCCVDLQMWSGNYFKGLQFMNKQVWF